MHSQPPPLPDSAAPSSENSFARQAANASLAVPIILVALRILFGALLQGHRDATGPIYVLTIAVICGFIVLVGIVMGLLALVLAKPGERAGVFARAGVGLGVCGLLIAIAVPNFIRGRQKALADQAALQDLKSTVSDLRQEASAALKQHDPHAVNLAKLGQSLDRAAKATSGDASIAMRAMHAYLDRIESQQKAYEKVSDELLVASVLQTSNLFNQSQIPPRKAKVQAFLDANNSFKAFIAQGAVNFRKELVNLKVSPEQVEAAVGGFQKTSGPQIPMVLAIRAADDRMGVAMLGILDLLDANWGRWRYNPATGKVRFDDPATLQRYNGYFGEIREAGRDQAMAQNRLSSLIKRPVSSL